MKTEDNLTDTDRLLLIEAKAGQILMNLNKHSVPDEFYRSCITEILEGIQAIAKGGIKEDQE